MDSYDGRGGAPPPFSLLRLKRRHRLRVLDQKPRIGRNLRVVFGGGEVVVRLFEQAALRVGRERLIDGFERDGDQRAGALQRLVVELGGLGLQVGEQGRGELGESLGADRGVAVEQLADQVEWECGLRGDLTRHGYVSWVCDQTSERRS